MHQDVDAAELVHRGLHHTLHRTSVPNVREHANGLPAGGTNTVDYFINEVLRRQRIDHNGGPGARQFLGGCAPDIARAACDNSHLAGKFTTWVVCLHGPTLLAGVVHTQAPAIHVDGLAGDVARLHPPHLTMYDTLETALSMMTDTEEEHLAVVDNNLTMQYRGCVHHKELMAAYNQALVDTRHEEHGE